MRILALWQSHCHKAKIVGRAYKILHSSQRSVQGAIGRNLDLCEQHRLPARIFMESTGIYHYPVYYRMKDAGLEAFILNPLITHAGKDINVRNVHNDKLDAQKIALLGLHSDLKVSIVPDDEVAAVKAIRQFCRNGFEDFQTRISVCTAQYLLLALQSVSLRLNGEPKNAVLRSYYQEKCKSKAKMTALGAIMYKFCNIVFAVLRDEKPLEFTTPQQHRQQFQTLSAKVA